MESTRSSSSTSFSSKHIRNRLVFALAIGLVASLLSSPFPSAQPPFKIAVFGNNPIDDYLNVAGFTATLVTDSELSTTGLAAYDAFFYTRDNANTPGASLSDGAAANVQAFVGSSGRGVLLNGDFADTLLGATPDTEIQQLISSATTWAAETHHGFIGEYTGAVAGLTGNSDSLTALGFVSGSAGLLSEGPADGVIVKTAAGQGSPVLAGVDFPLTDPTNELHFGSIVTGVDSALVLATYSNPGQPNDGNPAIISFAVPDPPHINALAPANGKAALNFIQTDDGEGSPDGGSPITEYRVLAQTVSPSASPCPEVLSSPSVVLTVGPTPNAADGSFSYLVPNLTNFTKYCLAVVGVNAVGSSAQSNVEGVIPTDQADATFVPAAGNITLAINPAGASATKTTKTTYTLVGSPDDTGNIVTLAVVPQPGGFSCFATVDAGVCPGGKIVHSEPGQGNDIHLEIDQIDTTVSTTRTGTLRHVCFAYPCATNTDPYFVYQDAPPAVLGPECAVNGVYVIGSSFTAGLNATRAATYGIQCAVPPWSKAQLANRVLKGLELNKSNGPQGNNDLQFQVWVAGDPKR